MRNNGLNLKKIIVAAVVLIVFAMGARYFVTGGPSADGIPAAGPKTPPAGSADATAPRPSPPDASSGALSAAATFEAALTSSAVTEADTSGVAAAPSGRRAVRPVDSAAKSGVITGNGVNIRSESRVDANNANVVVKVNKGERVQVIGAEKPVNDNKTWYNIKLKDGRTGFVREDLIKVE